MEFLAGLFLFGTLAGITVVYIGMVKEL